MNTSAEPVYQPSAKRDSQQMKQMIKIFMFYDSIWLLWGKTTGQDIQEIKGIKPSLPTIYHSFIIYN